jgi:V/A-type H+-transporting ATPase subunit C
LETVSTGDSNAAIVRGVLQEQLDAVNLRTALRLRWVPLEEERLKGYWVGEGGRITEGKFVALSRIEGISQALDQAHLSVQLSEKPEDEAALENALSRALSLKHAKLFWGDPLRINVPIGYLWMKTIEVTNLRLIARGKAYGLAQPEIERELLLF